MSVMISLLGIAALAVALMYALGLRSVLASPLPAGVRLRPMRQMQPPETFAPLFAERHDELSALGFSPLGWLLIQHEPADTPGARLLRLYVSDDGQVLAQVIAPFAMHEPYRCRVHFVSRCTDGRLLFTAPTMLQPLPPPPSLAVTQMAQYASLDEQLTAHRALLKGQGSSERWAGLASAVDRLQAYEDAATAQARTSGELLPHSDGGMRLNLRRAAGAIHSTLKLSRTAPVPVEDTEIPVQRALVYWRHQRLLGRHSPRQPVQWGLFLSSALAFAALGAWLWAPWFALLLLAVIALHEAGHWLAMRAFGYHNVQMLMLPLVGGVTIGHEQDPSARARAWISLMGPLPGIVLGCALLLAGVDAGSGWLFITALLLLAINLFNLLPILPLDGGHLLHVLLPERAPMVRTMFDVLAIIALVALARSLDAWWLVLLALVPFGNLRNAARDNRLLAALRQVRADSPPRLEVTEMEQALTVIRADPSLPPTLQAQFALAEHTLTQARVQPMPRRNVVLLSALWLGCFLAAAALPQVRNLVGIFMPPSWVTGDIEVRLAELTDEARGLSTADLVAQVAAMLDDGQPFSTVPGPPAASAAELATLERDIGQPLHPAWREVLRAEPGGSLRLLLDIGPVEQLRPLGERRDCLALIEDDASWPGFDKGKPVTFSIFNIDGDETGPHTLDRARLQRWLVPGTCEPGHHALRLIDIDDPDWHSWELLLGETFAVRDPGLRSALEEMYAGMALARRINDD